MTISDNSNDSNTPGVLGTNTAEGGAGVFGVAEAKGAAGVIGHAHAADGRGVYGESGNGTGVWGFSSAGNGVRGESAAEGGAGIFGVAEAKGAGGVIGHAHAVDGRGVYGESGNGTGVWGFSKAGNGVFGASEQGIGICGKGGRLAGFFEGDVEVTGDIRLINADCAEDFDVSGAVKVEPGTVMVLGHEGALSESQAAYDKRVAGVISGAGNYKPGIVLDKQQTAGNRQPVALMGKVFCKVDAQFGAIEVGDLLTTSPTPGHAMKTNDPFKAFGAVIGKALRPLNEGQGLIPILIALQ